MDFLKKLFGGGASNRDDALYLYVQPKMCKEIVKVRVDMRNHLSLNDEGNGYYVRKIVSGTRCPFQSEIEIFFNRERRITDQNITDGEFVTQADYEALYPPEEDEQD